MAALKFIIAIIVMITCGFAISYLLILFRHVLVIGRADIQKRETLGWDGEKWVVKKEIRSADIQRALQDDCNRRS